MITIELTVDQINTVLTALATRKQETEDLYNKAKADGNFSAESILKKYWEIDAVEKAINDQIRS